MKAYHFIELVKELAKTKGLVIEEITVSDPEGTSTHKKLKTKRAKIWKPGPHANSRKFVKGPRP